MRRIIEANIVHYKKLLESETDPTKRAMIMGLLAEEEGKLRQVEPNVKKAS